MTVEPDQGPITQAEMIELFGEAMPIEAVDALFKAPDHWTTGQVRGEIRRIAATQRARGRQAADLLTRMRDRIHDAPMRDEHLFDEAIQEIARLRWALRGGNATSDNAQLLEFLAARLMHIHGEAAGTDYILAARERAAMIRQALAHGR